MVTNPMLKKTIAVGLKAVSVRVRIGQDLSVRLKIGLNLIAAVVKASLKVALRDLGAHREALDLLRVPKARQGLMGQDALRLRIV